MNFRGMSNKCDKGFTLVELVISMLIISIVGLIGIRSFLQILQVNDEIRGRSVVYENAQIAVDEFRQTISNLIINKIGGIEIYSEGEGEKENEKKYSFLTQVPEKYMEDTLPFDTVAFLVEYSLKKEAEGNFSLSCSKIPVTLDGPGEKFVEGVIVSNLSYFKVSPNFKNVGGKVEAPDSFSVFQEYLIEGEKYELAIEFPVPTKPRDEGTS